MATTKTTKPKTDKERTAAVNADFVLFCRECLKIQNKHGELVPFALNGIQKAIVARVLYGDSFIVRRWMVLKPRQMGATTLGWAIAFWRTIKNTDHKALIMAHEEDLAVEILDRIRLAYEQLPDWYIKPKLAKDSAAALAFKGTRSAIYIGTAGSGVRKRGASAKLGRTYQTIYATELTDPAWERSTIVRLLQCAHELAVVILDSTANGAQGWYYKEWGKAKNGASNFLPLFFRWFEDKDSQREAGKDFKRTPEEEDLAKVFRLTNDQLAWRRWKLQDLTDEEFTELYPDSDIDCFLQSGSPCFHPASLQFFLDSEDHCRHWPTRCGSIQRVVPQ